jgi:hypothetical protein
MHFRNDPAEQIGKPQACRTSVLDQRRCQDEKHHRHFNRLWDVTGTQYNADAEGIFIVCAVDVEPLLAAGWLLKLI